MARPNAPKYPWNEWSDGKLHDLKHGRDFTVTKNIMAIQACAYARRHDIFVCTNLTRDGVRVRFFDTLKEATEYEFPGAVKSGIEVQPDRRLEDGKVCTVCGIVLAGYETAASITECTGMTSYKELSAYVRANGEVPKKHNSM